MLNHDKNMKEITLKKQLGDSIKPKIKKKNVCLCKNHKIMLKSSKS